MERKNFDIHSIDNELLKRLQYDGTSFASVATYNLFDMVECFRVWVGDDLSPGDFEELAESDSRSYAKLEIIRAVLDTADSIRDALANAQEVEEQQEQEQEAA